MLREDILNGSAQIPLGTGLRPGAGCLLAAGLAWGGLQFFPQAEVEVFARGAATLASLLTGAPVERVEEGWLLAATQPVVVNAACSATGYFLTVTALLAWRLAQTRLFLLPAAALAMAGALPLTLAVNAVRVVVLMHAHRWIIPRFPEAYGPFLHLLAGVAVFLPALIGLNLLLELYGKFSRKSG